MHKIYPVPFEEDEFYIELPNESVGFLKSSSYRIRIEKRYLADMLKWACVRELSKSKVRKRFNDAYTFVVEQEKTIMPAFNREMEAFKVLYAHGKEDKELECWNSTVVDFVALTLRSAMLREASRITNLIEDMLTAIENPTKEDWLEVIRKINVNQPSKEFEEEK